MVRRKAIVAVTGTLWLAFAGLHMLGNCLIFAGAETYNRYAHVLASTRLVYLAEVSLAVFLLMHASSAISLLIHNRGFKTSGYAVSPSKLKSAPWRSRSMGITGSLVLFFIVVHLLNFRFGKTYLVTYGGVAMPDLFRTVNDVFHQPLYVVGYVFSVVVLGLHLQHGIESNWISFGIWSDRRSGFIRWVSIGYAAAVTLGFSSQPLYIWWRG